MPDFATPHTASTPPDDTVDLDLSRLREHLTPLLSVIAGMVDLIGFFTLGNIFTAHVTGNVVVASAAGGARRAAEFGPGIGNSRLHVCRRSYLAHCSSIEQAWGNPGAAVARSSVRPTRSR